MADSLVVRGARLYDGRRPETLDDAVVLIRDERIVYAGTARGAPAAGRADVIDAEGRSLIPGLIDCHVHLCFDGSPDFAGDATSMTSERAQQRCAESAARALDAGITTVRDLGGFGLTTIEAARLQARGRIRGPRILTAGEVLTIPGGHAHFIGREIASSDEMIEGIRSLHESGAQLVKLIATGGVLTPGIGAQQSAFPAEQLDAGVAEAHRLGMRVAAHAIGAEGIQAAVEAGVDSIEHGCFLRDDSIEAMIAKPAWLVATLSAPEQIVRGSGAPDYAVRKSEEVMPAHHDSFRRAASAGVRIASGTDAGTPFNPHGALSLELKLMHDLGLPPDRVLSAATREAAQLLGVGDVGTVEDGKVADLALLDADPLDDVGAYAKVSLVVQAGRIVVDRR